MYVEQDRLGLLRYTVADQKETTEVKFEDIFSLYKIVVSTYFNSL
jgi:hypothetical protein